ncbi:DUF1062 domain-containing protein [Rhizobium cauense]|uniref:DUF1062 domain-containing protein n=1 Tax=Rhizobium cauense TaxID=1166683 RepID=UPI001C6E670C|nr:DUF1062 domain-containing protein [Rhizobium cauense]MBW9116422.1 DUF1062 domain-containing protein [Rhizobium cauense]
MCNILQVRWTIIPTTAPQPWLVCSGCGGLNAFQCSNKIRLNANGRKLDAWLIYECTTCDKTWNRSIFERRSVRDIDPATLEALQSNDPNWIQAAAFNLEALKRKSQRIDEFADVEVTKEVVGDALGWTDLGIEFSVPFPVSTRLDRLLASELAFSRSQLLNRLKNGLIHTNSDSSALLRRRVRDGCRVILDLSDLENRGMVGHWAAVAKISA